MLHKSYKMTSSNGNIFRVTGHLCGEFTGHWWIPRTKASDAELWCFPLIRALSKRLSKQSWGWWFDTPSRSLWLHCNDNLIKTQIAVFFATFMMHYMYYYTMIPLTAAILRLLLHNVSGILYHLGCFAPREPHKIFMVDKNLKNKTKKTHESCYE